MPCVDGCGYRQQGPFFDNLGHFLDDVVGRMVQELEGGGARACPARSLFSESFTLGSLWLHKVGGYANASYYCHNRADVCTGHHIS